MEPEGTAQPPASPGPYDAVESGRILELSKELGMYGMKADEFNAPSPQIQKADPESQNQIFTIGVPTYKIHELAEIDLVLRLHFNSISTKVLLFGGEQRQTILARIRAKIYHRIGYPFVFVLVGAGGSKQILTDRSVIADLLQPNQTLVKIDVVEVIDDRRVNAPKKPNQKQLIQMTPTDQPLRLVQIELDFKTYARTNRGRESLTICFQLSDSALKQLIHQYCSAEPVNQDLNYASDKAAGFIQVQEWIELRVLGILEEMQFTKSPLQVSKLSFVRTENNNQGTIVKFRKTVGYGELDKYPPDMAYENRLLSHSQNKPPKFVVYEQHGDGFKTLPDYPALFISATTTSITASKKLLDLQEALGEAQMKVELEEEKADWPVYKSIPMVLGYSFDEMMTYLQGERYVDNLEAVSVKHKETASFVLLAFDTRTSLSVVATSFLSSIKVKDTTLSLILGDDKKLVVSSFVVRHSNGALQTFLNSANHDTIFQELGDGKEKSVLCVREGCFCVVPVSEIALGFVVQILYNVCVDSSN